MKQIKEKVLKLMEENAYHEALDIMLDIVVEHEDAQLYALTGRCFYMIDDYAHAVKFLNWAIALDPNNAQYHTKLAMAYESLGEMEKAITHYNQALVHYTDIVFVMKRLDTLQAKDAA